MLNFMQIYQPACAAQGHQLPSRGKACICRAPAQPLPLSRRTYMYLYPRSPPKNKGAKIPHSICRACARSASPIRGQCEIKDFKARTGRVGETHQRPVAPAGHMLRRCAGHSTHHCTQPSDKKPGCSTCYAYATFASHLVASVQRPPVTRTHKKKTGGINGRAQRMLTQEQRQEPLCSSPGRKRKVIVPITYTQHMLTIFSAVRPLLPRATLRHRPP
jgi:hypothetical protein